MPEIWKYITQDWVSLILQLMPPLIGALIAMIPVWAARKTKPLFYLYSLTISILLSWIITSVVLVANIYKNNAQGSNILSGINAIRAAQGDDKKLEELMNSSRSLINEYASHSSSDFINDIRTNMPKMKEERRKIEHYNKELIDGYKIKWEQSMISFWLRLITAWLR